MFVPLKQRLEAFGIPTHEPWTRTGSTCALMYFRDPSGNQFEMFCPDGETGLRLRVGHRAGGDYVIPFPTLVYRELKEPTTAPPKIDRLGYNHMTLPSKDLEQSKRFLTEVFGGEMVIILPRYRRRRWRRDGVENSPKALDRADAEYHTTPNVDGGPASAEGAFGALRCQRRVLHRNGTDAAIYYRDRRQP
jgi:catechol 2,3-dioxygenase-like lactoylglutathione lyase family enzyme